MSSLLIRQSPLATGARVTSASSELGLSCGRVVAGGSNGGGLQLAASGIPSSALSLDVALQRGGLPAGPSSPAVTTPGTSARVRVTGGSSTSWLGYTDTPYQVWGGTIVEASSTTDVPGIGQIRQLGNGSLGICYQERGTVANAIKFAYKATQYDSWTTVTIENNVYVIEPTCPAMIVFPSGRIVVYYYRTVNGQAVGYAQSSTDHGATWSLYSVIRSIGATGGGALRAEVVGDYVMLVTSPRPDAAADTVRVRWSLDGGVSFGDGQTCTDPAASTSLHHAATCAGVDGTYAVVVLKASTFEYRAYQLAPGGGFGESTQVGTGYAGTGTVLGVVARDDGAIYCFQGTNGQYPARVIQALVSYNGGLSWDYVGGSVSAGTTIYRTGAATSHGPKSLSLGFWQGSVVGLVGNTATSSNDDDALLETWWGGWDSHTWENVGTESYCEVSYWPTDIPDGLGWTRNDVGAGATVALGSSGLSIVATGAANSYYDAPADFTPAAGESRNLTFVGKVTSGGSVADNRAILTLAIEDGTGNRQSLTFRFSTTQVRAIDPSGTLATATVDTTAGFELRVSFKHDEPSAGGGLATARIRVPGGVWTTVISNQAIAETATAGNLLRFGGTDVGAVDWSIALLRCSEDTDNEWQVSGFTNPTDLSGRGLGPLPVYVRSGVSLAAYHGIGVAGDTYVAATTYQYPATAVWSSKRPSYRWRTATDNTAHTLTCDGGGSLFAFDWVGLVNTNYPTATIKLNTSNSFVTPAFSLTLSAVVYSGTAAEVGKGFLRVDGRPWRSGQFRSRAFGGGLGRRWFLAVSTTVTYEITDNEEDRLLIEGVDLSGFPGVSFQIFADRMSSPRLPNVQRYEFLQLSIPAAQTADNLYQTGLLWIGRALGLQDYANGYSDEYAGNVSIVDADVGTQILTRAGPATRRKRIAWDAIDDQGFDWFPSRLRDYLGGVDINAEPVILVEDDGRQESRTNFLLGVADGPLTYENVVGGEQNPLVRIAQMPFREWL